MTNHDNAKHLGLGIVVGIILTMLCEALAYVIVFV